MLKLYRTEYPGFVTEIFSDAIRKASAGTKVFINQFDKLGIIIDWSMCSGNLIWTRGCYLDTPLVDLIVLENPTLKFYERFQGRSKDIILINPQYDVDDYDQYTYMKVFR
jgi:hypothetical protein